MMETCVTCFIKPLRCWQNIKTKYAKFMYCPMHSLILAITYNQSMHVQLRFPCLEYSCILPFNSFAFPRFNSQFTLRRLSRPTLPAHLSCFLIKFFVTVTICIHLNKFNKRWCYLFGTTYNSTCTITRRTPTCNEIHEYF